MTMWPVSSVTPSPTVGNRLRAAGHTREHQRGVSDCTHKAAQHGDHVDYVLHEGHRHDELRATTTSTDPAGQAGATQLTLILI